MSACCGFIFGRSSAVISVSGPSLWLFPTNLDNSAVAFTAAGPYEGSSPPKPKCLLAPAVFEVRLPPNCYFFFVEAWPTPRTVASQFFSRLSFSSQTLPFPLLQTWVVKAGPSPMKGVNPGDYFSGSLPFLKLFTPFFLRVFLVFLELSSNDTQQECPETQE